MLAYNPELQLKICTQKEMCFISNFPTLGLLDAAYGEKSSVIWLLPQLYDLEEFCGCKGKFTEHQIKTLATMISSEYYHLKVSEIMLFFYRMKSGHYGIFYGSLDPMKVMASMLKFMEERSAFLADYDRRKQEQRIEEDNRRCMSYEEYKRTSK